MSTNPFLTKSTLAYELPPFELIQESHYLEAFYTGMSEQLAEIDAILAKADVTFENTIEALERSGAPGMVLGQHPHQQFAIHQRRLTGHRKRKHGFQLSGGA